ncbi:MAG TPA: asparagine synthase (glutamine-hydrolyzing) [Candidatus Paceibacterota bacterium]
MCGLVGFIGAGSEHDLRFMVASLKHRGRDDEGLFFEKGLALGHTRLSILDLTASGHQPMFNVKKTVGVVFNGEIYNFKELRQDLENLGYIFVGHSDTEVIVNLYDYYKEACFEKLNGMFAIALYDFVEHKLVLVRDRMGKKPLYWAQFEGTLLFGSELKALLEHSLFKKEIDLSSLNKYLYYQYVPTPNTIFKNVYKLEPATYLIYTHGKIVKRRFWNANFNTRDRSFNESIAILNNELELSVKRRLVSDVPIGVFLSGGLDSSTIAYYAQKNSAKRVKTFSIGFDETDFDESRYANDVAHFLGTEHYERKVSSKNSLDLVTKIPDLFDEPVADPSIIPTYLLSSFAKEHITVALGGDGGDELFGGYQTFQAEYFASWYRKVPRFFREEMIKKIVNAVPIFDKDFSPLFFIKKFIEGIDDNNFYTHQNWLSAYRREERKELFNPEVWESLENENEFDHIDRYRNEIESDDERQKLLYMYMRTYLMDEVLVKVDRASMAHALEVRAPFLDYQLVDFVNTLPYEFKVKGLTTKYILKQLMRDVLPRNIVSRTKKGFSVPLSLWLQTDLKDLCNAVLAKEKIEQQGLFNYDFIEKIKNEHFTNVRNNSRKLWTLLSFSLWYERWGK